MMKNHVSELAIDRLLAGEFAAPDAAAIRDHARSCVRCGAMLDDALATQRAFVALRPPLGLPVPLHRRRAVMATFGALAAAAAIVVAWPRAATETVRTKGTAIVGFFVAHGDAVRRGRVREPVMPGDRIELFTTTTERAWFAAIGDDAAGKRSVYVEPRLVEPGQERVVPFAITLDETLGDEVVTAVFCPERFDPLAPPANCTIDRFTLVKVPR